MAFTEAFKNTMLDALPDTVYIAFFAGGGPGVGTEVTPATLWGSGNRPAVSLAAASGAAITPDGDATIGTVDVASQAVTHLAYYDAANAGNLIGFVAYARTFIAGELVSIPDGNNVFVASDPA